MPGSCVKCIDGGSKLMRAHLRIRLDGLLCPGHLHLQSPPSQVCIDLQNDFRCKHNARISYYL